MIELDERKGDSPICPHCEKIVKVLHYQQIKGWLGRRYIYFCSSCSKVLGISHRKGLWMG